MASWQRCLGRLDRAEDPRGIPEFVHPCARQGGTAVRVLRAPTRFEPTAGTRDPIHMGTAIPS